MKIQEATQIQVMNRIQCLRDINESIQEQIEKVRLQKQECCGGGIYENALTLEGEYLTLAGDFLTVE